MYDGTFAATSGEAEVSATLRISALVTAGGLLLTLFLPFVTGAGSSGSLSEAGSPVVVYFIVMAAVLVIAAVAVRSADVAAGLAGGAAICAVGYLVLVDSLMYVILDAFSSFGGADPGVAFFSSAVAAIAGVACIIESAQTRFVTRATVDGPFVPFGVCAGLGVILGAMLPPADSGIGFKEMNFEFEPVWVNASWLVFMASLGAGAVIGFSSRTRWGLALAFGSWLPVAWLTLAAIIDLYDDAAGVSVLDTVHPVLLIAVAAWALALIAAYQSKQSADDLAVDPTPNGVTSFAPARPAAAVRAATAPHRAQGSWAPDPFGRFQLRFHNGKRWTANVASDGVTGTDQPEHPAPATGNGNGMWATDPFGNYRHRFHDGRAWTSHVADGSGATLHDPPGYPAPPAPEPLPPPPPPTN